MKTRKLADIKRESTRTREIEMGKSAVNLYNPMEEKTPLGGIY